MLTRKAKPRRAVPCRVDCKCAACGGVKMHVGGERQPSHTPAPAVQALDQALRAMVATGR
jgi:hypothetical protein